MSAFEGIYFISSSSNMQVSGDGSPRVRLLTMALTLFRRLAVELPMAYKRPLKVDSGLPPFSSLQRLLLRLTTKSLEALESPGISM